MNQESNDVKKKIQEQSKKLAELGSALAKSQFTYKIEEKVSKEYWEEKIQKLEKYKQTSLEYYSQVQKIMMLINKDEAQRFLLQISKFHQLSTELIKAMHQIKENPSIIDSKDKQQSQWSKKIKESVLESSTKCLENEKDMNLNFRKFYEKEIKKLVE